VNVISWRELGVGELRRCGGQDCNGCGISERRRPVRNAEEREHLFVKVCPKLQCMRARTVIDPLAASKLLTSISIPQHYVFEYYECDWSVAACKLSTSISTPQLSSSNPLSATEQSLQPLAAKIPKGSSEKR